jgi:hypothetical protein
MTKFTNFSGSIPNISKGEVTIAYGGANGGDGNGVGGVIWNPSTYKFAGALSVSASENSPVGLWFRPDGTKVYYVGTGSDIIREHTLSQPWNILSAGAVSSSPVLTGNITGIAFDDTNGDKVLAVDNGTNLIYKYSLSTPWNITTLNATPVQTNSAIFTSNQLPSSVWARNNGTLLMLGNTGTTATYRTATMSTAWDLTTLAAGTSIPVAGAVGAVFADNGNRFSLLTLSGGITNYSASSAYSIASPTVIQGTAFIGRWSNLAGNGDIYWKNDGSAFYVINSTDDAIYQYTL